MANKIEIVSKTGAKFQTEMSNEQKTFVPHLLFRITDDFVADACEKVAITDRESLISTFVNAFNVAYGLELNADDYDFGGKYNRAKPKLEREPRAKGAKGDKTSSIGAYIEEIVLALNKKQAEITANPEIKPVSIKSLRGFIKGVYELSEQTVDTILLNEKIAKHPAIEKIELSL